MRRMAMGARSGTDPKAPPPGSAVTRLRRWLTRWTMRRQLVAGFGLALLPLILLLAHTVDERFAGRRAEELRSNREFAEAVAATFDAYVGDVDHQLLAQAFTLGWRLDLNDPALVQAYLALNRVPYPSLALLALTDADGRLIAADPPAALGSSLADAAYVRAARDSRDGVVSDLLLPPDRTAPWFAVARAVHRPDGGVAGVLVAYVDAASLGEVLRLDRLGRAGYTILDPGLRVVYDSQHPDLTWEQRTVAALPHVDAAVAGNAATTE